MIYPVPLEDGLDDVEVAELTAAGWKPSRGALWIDPADGTERMGAEALRLCRRDARELEEVRRAG